MFWQSTANASLPKTDSYDKAISRYCESIGSRYLKKEIVSSGKRLTNLREKFGKSLIVYKQYQLKKQKVNVLTFENSENAKEFLKQITNSGTGGICLQKGNSFVEIVYNDLSEGLKLWSYLQPDSIINKIVELDKRGIAFSKVANGNTYLSEISKRLKVKLTGLYNCICTINDSEIKLNFLIGKEHNGNNDIVNGLKSFGVKEQNIVAIDGMIIEIVKKGLTPIQASEIYSALSDNKVNLFLEDKLTKLITVNKAKYLTCESSYSNEKLQPYLKSATELGVLLDNGKFINITIVGLDDGCNISEVMKNDTNYGLLGDGILIRFNPQNESDVKKLMQILI